MQFVCRFCAIGRYCCGRGYFERSTITVRRRELLPKTPHSHHATEPADRFPVPSPVVQFKMSAAVDIVTLENFEAKMPRWDPANASHLYALVDMGR